MVTEVNQTNTVAWRWLGVQPFVRMLRALGRSVHEYQFLKKSFRRPFWTQAVRLYRGQPQLVKLELQDGRPLWIRAGTGDAAVVRTVFFLDDYHIDALPAQRLSWVVDVGAHIGTFVVKMAPHADRILAFEPVAENRQVLERNLAALPPGKVELVPAAVTDHAGVLRLQLGANPGAHSAFPSHDNTAAQSRTVPCVRLPDMLDARNIKQIDFLKLDCEGAEYGILASLQDWGLQRIQRIALEYHPVQGASVATHSGEALEQLLRAAGFEVTRIPQKNQAGLGIIYASRRS